MATIRVGISQLSIAKSPDSLETQALGSCVAVVLYDSCAKIGGLAHTMLPDQSSAKKSSRDDLAKFVDTATEELLRIMIKNGARKDLIKAKLVGGANMFPDIAVPDKLHIGKRNSDTAKMKLEELGIKLVAEDTGGSLGRTVILDTATGDLLVRTIRFGEKII